MFNLRAVNVALALLVVSFAAPASAQQNHLICTSNVANPTQARAFAFTELLGDIVVVCTGAPSIAAGFPIPQIDLTVTTNTPITSRIVDPRTRATEALLLVNEPGVPPYYYYPDVPNGYGPLAPQILCPTPLTGCPQQIAYLGPVAVPVLPGVTVPPPVQDAPNVFEGILTAPNQITFFGVPLAPAVIPVNGPYATALVLRMTNLRASTTFAGAGEPGWTSVLAHVSSSSSPSVLIQSPLLTAANVFPGLQVQNGSFDFVPCPSGNICPLKTLRFREGFASATKTRGGFDYSGTPLPPQNVPGMVYSGVESGFYAPAMVNASPAAPIGLADFGTRLKAVLKVPPGVRLWVGTGVLPPAYGYLNATLTSSDAGPFNATAATFAIYRTAVAELPVVNGIATAVWEVLSANPAAQETFDFPLFVSYTNGVAPSVPWTFQGSFAPTAASFPPDGGLAHGFDYPIPRFPAAASLLLPSSLTLAPGQEAPLPVTLAAPADPSGVAITFTSADPSVATVTPFAVVFGGALAPDRRLPIVTALKFGRTSITASAPGYASASVPVNVSLTMSFSPPGLTLPLGDRQARPLLTLSAPAPPGGLVVTLSSDNPAVAAVPASVVIPENSLSVAVQVSPGTPGITTIRARVSSFVPEAALTVAVTP